MNKKKGVTIKKTPQTYVLKFCCPSGGTIFRSAEILDVECSRKNQAIRGTSLEDINCPDPFLYSITTICLPRSEMLSSTT